MISLRSYFGFKGFYLLLHLVFIAILSTCAEPFEQNTEQKLSIHLHLVHEELLGTDPYSKEPDSAVAIAVGEQVELWAIPLLENSIVTLEASDTLPYREAFWTLNGSITSGFRISKIFNEAKTDTAIFHLIEFLGDTIRDTLILYINKPLMIQPLFPEADQLDLPLYSHESITFRWELSGVDSWESANVQLRIQKGDSLYIQSISSNNGTGSMEVYLPQCEPDSICTYWWNLLAWVESPMGTGATDQDTSSIRLLQSRKQYEVFANMILFVRLGSNKPSPSTILYSIHKDLLDTVYWAIDTITGKATSPALIPGQWLIVAKDTLLKEFRADSLEVELQAGIRRDLGEIMILKDVIPPQITALAPYLLQRNSIDTLRFLTSDFGSGLLAGAIETSWSIESKIYNDTVEFSWNQLTQMDLDSAIHITVKDKTGNLNSDCYWRLLANTESVAKVTGPFCNLSLSEEAE